MLSSLTHLLSHTAVKIPLIAGWLLCFRNALGQRLFHSLIQLNSDGVNFEESLRFVLIAGGLFLAVSFPSSLWCTSWHTVAAWSQLRGVSFYLLITKISLFSRVSLGLNFPTLFQIKSNSFGGKLLSSLFLWRNRWSSWLASASIEHLFYEWPGSSVFRVAVFSACHP